MPIMISQTPNPNALKFTVPDTFDAPQSHVAGSDTDDPVARALLDVPGVTSVFMSADFVTISKGPDAYWDEIAPAASAILEAHYAD
jgi:hypothetical protein